MIRPGKSLCSVLLVLVLLAPAVMAGGSMFRADPTHTGVFTVGSTEPNNVLKWSFDEKNHRITSPTVSDGIVYFGSEDNSLYALYARNGTVKWNFTTGGLVRSAPAVSGGVVYFGSGDENVYALDASNGSVIWQVPTTAGQDGVGYSAPAVADGSVYIVSYDRNLYAINATSGSVRWTFPFVSPMGSEAGSSPAVVDGTVFFGDLNRNVYGVYAANGTEKWQYIPSASPMATIPPSTPVISNGILYMGGPGNHNLTALWAENGTPMMQISRGTSSWDMVSPAIRDGILYTGGADRSLYAINATTGEDIWSLYLGSLLSASPSISGDIVYAPSLGKVLFAVYTVNGTEKWRFSPPENKGLWGAPVISDGIVYIDGNSADFLYAVGNQEPAPQFFAGCVRAGEVGNLTGRGLRDLPIRLFGSNTTDTPGSIISSTVTDSYGYFMLQVPDTPYLYLNILQEDTVPGSLPAGAQSTGGIVMNATWIQYTTPAGATNLTGNNFWDYVPTVSGNFIATPLSGPAPLTVFFTDNSTGYPVTWNWIHEYNTTIGNGLITGLAPNTTHVYMQPGSYSVQMRVFNAVSSDWVTKVDYITVLGTLPVVDFEGAPKSGTAPLTVGFTDRSTGDRTAWNWTFGDGSPNSTEIHPTHTYQSQGTYSVTLTVANTYGSNTTTRTNYITVNPPGPAPTISSITPITGLKNTTIAFSISGKNFPAGSVVNFTNTTCGNVTWTPGKITKTKITGSVLFPSSAPSGKWDVVVTVPDGRNATRKGAFTVNPWKPPKITSITPTSGYPNATVPFSLSGSDFEPGAIVNFTNTTYGNVTAAINSVTLTKITGSVLFPPAAPTGKWDISVTTPDGGQGPAKKNAFTVNAWKAPTITSIAPMNGFVNTTASFSVSGTNFQPYCTVDFRNSTYGIISTTVGTITPAKITGFVSIPWNVPPGKFDLVVTVPDGRNVTRKGAFTVKGWSKPTISSINQTKGTHGTTLKYAITGTNFQPGSTVTFTNSSAPGLNFTAGVSTLTTTRITGSVFIPADRIGKYGIEILCPDGKTASRSGIFTVK